jgi:hypothetical protein
VENSPSERRNRSSLVSYRFAGIIPLAIEYPSSNYPLRKQLKAHKAEGTEDPSIKLKICTSEIRSPTAKGKYKGIPWQWRNARGEDGSELFEFHSALFTSYFFTRMILIPVLKRELIKRKAALVIGSSFIINNTLYVLTGQPGSGKTSLLLDAIGHGASFVGDDELFVAPGNKVSPLTNFIQLRYYTVKPFPLWKALTFFEKLYLKVTALLSAGTFRFVNLALERSYIPALTAAPEGTRCVRFTRADSIREVEASSFIQSILEYEKEYQAIYGSLIYTPQSREALGSILSELLSDHRFFEVPRYTSYESLFTAASQSPSGRKNGEKYPAGNL